MSITVYTHSSIDLSDLKLVPTETIMIDKNNISILDSLKIKTLPAALKNVAGKITIIEGENFYSLNELTIDEISSDINHNRNKKN